MMIFGARPLLAAARQAAASNDVAGPRSAARPPQALAPSRRQKKQGLSASFAVQAKLSKVGWVHILFVISFVGP